MGTEDTMLGLKATGAAVTCDVFVKSPKVTLVLINIDKLLLYRRNFRVFQAGANVCHRSVQKPYVDKSPRGQERGERLKEDRNK